MSGLREGSGADSDRLQAAFAPDAGEPLRKALAEVLLPAAWQEMKDQPGFFVTILSAAHMERLRALLDEAPAGEPE